MMRGASTRSCRCCGGNHARDEGPRRQSMPVLSRRRLHVGMSGREAKFRGSRCRIDLSVRTSPRSCWTRGLRTRKIKVVPGGCPMCPALHAMRSRQESLGTTTCIAIPARLTAFRMILLLAGHPSGHRKADEINAVGRHRRTNVPPSRERKPEAEPARTRQGQTGGDPPPEPALEPQRGCAGPSRRSDLSQNGYGRQFSKDARSCRA